MKQTVIFTSSLMAEAREAQAFLAAEGYHEDFIRWFETDPRAEEYRHLRWDRELQEAREKEAAVSAR